MEHLQQGGYHILAPGRPVRVTCSVRAVRVKSNSLTRFEKSLWLKAILISAMATQDDGLDLSQLKDIIMSSAPEVSLTGFPAWDPCLSAMHSC